MSLLAAFVAMLGKQWLNRYMRHAGGSMIDRCGDRQRKCDGLQRWPFRLFVESLPVMLQIALLLLACGLCKHMTSINTSVANTLITLTGLGVLFYVGVVIAGASSYDCPLQTPGSALLRSSWTKLRPRLTPIVLPIIDDLRTLRETVGRHAFVVYPLVAIVHRHLLRTRFRLQQICESFQHPPLPTTQEVSRSSGPQETIRWFAPKEQATVQTRNTNNVRCVFWILRNITDLEALDAAIRLAGIIWWFEDGIDMKPLYDLIVSTFHSCFGSNVLYPELRNRAYYSGRAILWIHTLAVCKPEVSTQMFPLPTTQYTAPASDSDLTHLLFAFRSIPHLPDTIRLFHIDKGHSHSHSQWISSLLLHLSWAAIAISEFPSDSLKLHLLDVDASTPLDVTFNRLLMCCNLLRSPIGEEVLKMHDKSYGVPCPRPQVTNTTLH